MTVTKEEWVEALIYNDYDQETGGEYYYKGAVCALGVAALLDEEFNMDNINDFLPEKLADLLFYKDDFLSNAPKRYFNHIIHMNDDEGLSLQEIGDHIKNDQVLKRSEACTRCQTVNGH